MVWCGAILPGASSDVTTDVSTVTDTKYMKINMKKTSFSDSVPCRVTAVPSGLNYENCSVPGHGMCGVLESHHFSLPSFSEICCTSTCSFLVDYGMIKLSLKPWDGHWINNYGRPRRLLLSNLQCNAAIPCNTHEIFTHRIRVLSSQ